MAQGRNRYFLFRSFFAHIQVIHRQGNCRQISITEAKSIVVSDVSIR